MCKYRLTQDIIETCPKAAPHILNIIRGWLSGRSSLSALDPIFANSPEARDPTDILCGLLREDVWQVTNAEQLSQYWYTPQYGFHQVWHTLAVRSALLHKGVTTIEGLPFRSPDQLGNSFASVSFNLKSLL